MKIKIGFSAIFKIQYIVTFISEFIYTMSIYSKFKSENLKTLTEAGAVNFT